MKSLLAESDPGAADFIQALQELLACMQRHTDEIQPAFVRDVRREAPELFQLAEKRRAELIQRHFGRVFAEGRRVGLIRKDIPLKWMIEILLGATQAFVNPTKLADLGLTVRGGFSAVSSVVLSGVLTSKGNALLCTLNLHWLLCSTGFRYCAVSPPPLSLLRVVARLAHKNFRDMSKVNLSMSPRH